MRIKRPDKKNAISLIESAKREIDFTLKLPVSLESGTTITRNIYESFRKLGDALLVSKGIESHDHLLPIKELMNLNIKTLRPLNLLDNLRKIRHNINYYGYQPSLVEIKNTISIAKELFKPIYDEIKKRIS